MVEFFGEVGEGFGEAGVGWWLEGDFDVGGGVGDGSGEVEEVAGVGAVFVGVFEVGVEVVGEEEFTVVGQEAQDHLEGASIGGW